jgi:hypothetical protein
VVLYGDRLGAALTNTINLCAQADRLATMQDARAWPVVGLVQQLWAAAIRSQQDLGAQSAKLSVYVVPFTQSMLQLSMTLYGDATHVSDLLALNAVDDATAVRAGTNLKFFPPKA